MFDLSPWALAGMAFCALLVGFTKTGVPGLGILAVPIFASIMPARASTGILLAMLITGDLFAVAYYRRHAVWSHLARLLPWAVPGIVTGWLVMRHVDDALLRHVIGGTVLLMLVLGEWQNRSQWAEHIPHHWLFAAVIGFSGGVVTMMANAAGPLMVIYLLAMRLPRHEFIGTGAWYFLLVNWFKVPFQIALGNLDVHALRIVLVAIPLIAVGAIVGRLVVQRISDRLFNRLAQVLAAAAALRLLWV